MTLPTQTMAANLAKVADGLRGLCANLEASGYPEAIAGYRQMKQVLLQQRLISLPIPDEELQDRWMAIQIESDRVAGILQPFLEVMEDIARIAAMSGIHERQDEAGMPADTDIGAVG